MATWQHCQFYLAQNAVQHGPDNAIRKRIGKQRRAVWNGSSFQAAEAELAALVASYRDKHSDFADWLKNNLPEALAVFTLPKAHHTRMRTANGIERPIQQELKRRTSEVRVFPNRDSLERLSTAVRVEIDEKWETETNAYIKWKKHDDCKLHGNFQTSGCVISKEQVDFMIGLRDTLRFCNHDLRERLYDIYF